VLNAELAQSYMAQPKISLLSFTIVPSFAMIPPRVELDASKNTRQYKEFRPACKAVAKDKVPRFVLDPQPATR
jgi:hypothetical protein